jgi:hypothetical protein
MFLQLIFDASGIVWPKFRSVRNAGSASPQSRLRLSSVKSSANPCDQLQFPAEFFNANLITLKFLFSMLCMNLPAVQGPLLRILFLRKSSQESQVNLLIFCIFFRRTRVY